MTEEWRDIPDWEGFYQASSLGRIRSVDRDIIRIVDGRSIKVRRRGRVLKLELAKTGYLTAGLHRDGGTFTTSVHILVCCAFRGPRPDNSHAAHNDGNRINNCAENIRWATPQENFEDKIRHGNVVKGERQGQSKLTDDAVRIIRKSDLSGYELAELYGVSETTIRHARIGKTWRHIV